MRGRKQHLDASRREENPEQVKHPFSMRYDGGIRADHDRAQRSAPIMPGTVRDVDAGEDLLAFQR